MSPSVSLIMTPSRRVYRELAMTTDQDMLQLLRNNSRALTSVRCHSFTIERCSKRALYMSFHADMPSYQCKSITFTRKQYDHKSLISIIRVSIFLYCDREHSSINDNLTSSTWPYSPRASACRRILQWCYLQLSLSIRMFGRIRGVFEYVL